MRKIGFTETVLRDANQSLLATRMPFADFEAILGELDKAGYYSLECWGGATFLPHHRDMACNPEDSGHAAASVAWCLGKPF